jgi:uroporphyrinogen decarboxylase
MNKVLLNLFENKQKEIPIWFLRQSGRHIPEYFQIRSKARNFVDFCLNKDLIVESTKLPLKYYDLDAAIIFSDILMVPWAMKRDLNFIKGEGPVLTPMIPNETRFKKKQDIFQSLRPIEDAIRVLKKDLPKNVSLIGFAGAPWTLSCYMIEGKGSKDFINTRTAIWSSNKWFMDLIETLINYVAQKLELQARAGADVLMIFDSWSHMIPNHFFHELGIKPIAKIIEILRSKNVLQPIIGFPFKAGTSLIQYSYESNVDCIALDWSVDLGWALKNLNSSIVFQGNLDPAALIPENNKYLEESVLSILDKMRNRKLIFNVGHGLTPNCKIENVRNVINIVRNFK